MIAKGFTDRERDAERKREQRAKAKDVVIPPCADRPRREAHEADIFAWLRFYFGEIFTYEFTPQQRDMILAIQNALANGDDQALAASRGEGKTTLAECVLIYCVLTGVVSFAVLFSATGADAEHSLEAIKDRLSDNEALLADYPEVCVPIVALENTPNRAHYQTVSGHRHDNGEAYANVPSKFSWCGREVVLPNVPGSCCAGAIIATRGLDSAVRGLKIGNKRPDLAVIDDPDTIDTANSEEQAKKLEDKLDKAIAGLGGQKRRIARVMLTTLQNRRCVSYKFTDPAQKASWRGKRFRFMVQPPVRQDLWEEYVQLQIADWQSETTKAHELYVANRDAMDEGGVVANPNRYTTGELSAFQHYYNQVARIGPEAVATEYDNDPAEELGPVESGISAGKIKMRLSGFERGIVPPDCTLLSHAMDIQKAGGHWVVKAWKPDATMYVVDYGFHETHGTTRGSDEGIERAILNLIHERMEYLKENPYRKPDGQIVEVAITLIDSGWQTPTVYQACREVGLGCYPAKGHGKSHGCATPNFHDVFKRTTDRKPGDGWFQSRLTGANWLINCDTDRWKSFEHARWMTPEGKPGAAYLFGEMSEEERRFMDKRMPQAAKDHHSFAAHLTAEVETEDIIRGTMKRTWKVKPGRVQNHYLDASYMASVAASMAGMKLFATATPKQSPAERPTAAQLAARSRG